MHGKNNGNNPKVILAPLLILVTLLLSGCAMDATPEEQDFFYHGWVHPERASQERMYGRKYAGRLNPDDSPRHPLPGGGRPF